MSFSDDARVVTLALEANLAHVRWAWAHPHKAGDKVSVPVQQVATFLLLLATCPLEDMLSSLDGDPLTIQRKRAMDIPDLQAGAAEGLRAHLPQWRAALAAGRVRMVLAEDGRHVFGVRAWHPETAGHPAWTMTLDTERVSAVVHALLGALPYWRLPPLKRPPTTGASGNARQSGTS